MRLFDQLSGIDLGKMNATEFLDLQQKGLDDFFWEYLWKSWKEMPIAYKYIESIVKSSQLAGKQCEKYQFQIQTSSTCGIVYQPHQISEVPDRFSKVVWPDVNSTWW